MAARVAAPHGDPSLARRSRPPITPLAVLALVAVVGAGCSSPPVSQATSAPVPSAAASASTAPAPSSDPGPGESTGPTEAPPTEAASPGDASRIPDKPADVTWAEVGREPAGQGTEKVTNRITWSAPEGVATQFTVVGVTECLRNEKRFDGKPCLVRGMRIPKDAQRTITKVAGDLREVEISWKVGEIGPPPYSAVLIRASNAKGDSIFAIAWSDTVCFGCVY